MQGVLLSPPSIPSMGDLEPCAGWVHSQNLMGTGGSREGYHQLSAWTAQVSERNLRPEGGLEGARKWNLKSSVEKHLSLNKNVGCTCFGWTGGYHSD
jgi:hypothetical protein